MARLILACLLFVAAASGQARTDSHIKQAGVCPRCHVISVVEWGMSAHTRARTDCVACHGESEGHVVDERNNVKPERLPKGAGIAGLCSTCHTSGCGRTKANDDCQSCHHIHALVDSRKAPLTHDPQLDARAAGWRDGESRLAAANRLAQAGDWPAAASIYREAAPLLPGDSRPRVGLAAAEARLAKSSVRVEVPNAPPFELVLVSAGEFEMGSDSSPFTRPVHTRRVNSFYLARTEVTNALWQALMNGSSPSAEPSQPARRLSFEDAQMFLAKLNSVVPGGGFRLPTEQEWEYAARMNSRLGLLELQGGVWEWCSSLALPYPYNPSDGRESLLAPGLRVLRGGGFGDSSDFLDISFRHSERPDRRLKSNGLRLARGVSTP